MPNLKSKEPSIFSEPYAVDLMLYLEENGMMMAVELKKIHSNYPKMVTLARRLSDLGLLNIEVENKPRIQYTYKLTEKGKKVAEKLIEIEGIIGE